MRPTTQLVTRSDDRYVGFAHSQAATIFRTEIGYDGPLTIEREIPEDPTQQKADIGKAVALLEELRAKILS